MGGRRNTHIDVGHRDAGEDVALVDATSADADEAGDRNGNGIRKRLSSYSRGSLGSLQASSRRGTHVTYAELSLTPLST